MAYLINCAEFVRILVINEQFDDENFHKNRAL